MNHILLSPQQVKIIMRMKYYEKKENNLRRKFKRRSRKTSIAYILISILKLLDISMRMT